MGNPRLHLLRGREIGLYLSILPFIRKISNQSCERERKNPSYSCFRCNNQVFVFLILDEFSNS